MQICFSLFLFEGKGSGEKAGDILTDGNEAACRFGSTDVSFGIGDAADTLLHIGNKGNVSGHDGKVTGFTATGKAGDLSLEHRARGGADVKTEKVHVL